MSAPAISDPLSFAAAAADAYRRRYGFTPRGCFFVRSDLGGLLAEGPVGSVRLYPMLLALGPPDPSPSAPADEAPDPSSDVVLGAWLR